MNKSGMIFISIIFLIASSCQEKIDIEKEEKAIKAVLEKSSNAYQTRDFEAMASTWLHDESVARLNAGKFGYGFSEGWEKQDERYKTMFKNNPDPSPNKEIFSNHRIKVYPQSAFVIYDKELRGENNELINEGIYTAYLEKDNDQWKLAYLSTLQSTSYDVADKNLAMSEIYHKLNPDDIGDILTDDFIGRNEMSRRTWTKENHFNFWTKNKGAAQDSIYGQLGQGNWIATMFRRKMKWQGKDIEAELMQFKRFEDSKIAEIFEFGDSKQWE